MSQDDVVAIARSDFLGSKTCLIEVERTSSSVLTKTDESSTQYPDNLDAGPLGACDRLGKPISPANMGKGKRGTGLMESREEARRKAEAVKDTEQEIEGLIPVKVNISPNLGIVYSLRFTPGEMSFLREAAQRRGMKLSEFIREVAMNAAAQAQDKPTPRDEALKEARELVGAAARALDKIAKP